MFRWLILDKLTSVCLFCVKVFCYFFLILFLLDSEEAVVPPSCSERCRAAGCVAWLQGGSGWRRRGPNPPPRGWRCVAGCLGQPACWSSAAAGCCQSQDTAALNVPLSCGAPAPSRPRRWRMDCTDHPDDLLDVQTADIWRTKGD